MLGSSRAQGFGSWPNILKIRFGGGGGISYYNYSKEPQEIVLRILTAPNTITTVRNPKPITITTASNPKE